MVCNARAGSKIQKDKSGISLIWLTLLKSEPVFAELKSPGSLPSGTFCLENILFYE